MEKGSLNEIEDQPKPKQPNDASPEANARFQESVNAFSAALMRKFQMSGNQFNALKLELRVFVANEQIQLLAEIIKASSGGTVTDETLTDAMTGRVEKMTKGLLDALAAAPRVAIAGDMPPRMNGSKHN